MTDLHAFAATVQASSGSGEEAEDEGESSDNDEDAEEEDDRPPAKKAKVVHGSTAHWHHFNCTELSDHVAGSQSSDLSVGFNMVE